MSGFSITGVKHDGVFFGMSDVKTYEISTEEDGHLLLELTGKDDAAYEPLRMRAVTVVYPDGEVAISVRK